MAEEQKEQKEKQKRVHYEMWGTVIGVDFSFEGYAIVTEDDYDEGRAMFRAAEAKLKRLHGAEPRRWVWKNIEQWNEAMIGEYLSQRDGGGLNVWGKAYLQML